MKKHLLPVCVALIVAMTQSAHAAITVLYATITPETQTTFLSGSKPTLKVTLSNTVSTDTVVTLTPSGDSLSPATMTVPAGQRYGYAVLTCNGVAANTDVNVQATLGGSSVTSRNITITPATYLRFSVLSGDTALPVNTIHHFEGNGTYKLTLNGWAPPGGFSVTMNATGKVIVSNLVVTANANTSIGRSGFAVFTQVGPATVTISIGGIVVDTINVTVVN
jgi:hypothetical protein